MSGSGDGWITCSAGHRHWGRYGASGLLLRRSTHPGSEVLLQLRVSWSHHGDTWGLPGGARDLPETALRAALREAAEEAAVDSATVCPEASWTSDHGGWAYTTVVGSASAEVHPYAAGGESADVRWVPDADVDRLPLHPGFAASWPALRVIGPAPELLVDAANTIGSRADGWWRDRAGAVGRLRDQLASALTDGLDLGETAGAVPVRRWPVITLVTEGAARGVEAVPGVRIVPAAGSGDDQLVALADDLRSGPRPVVVVTADHELRRRLEGVAARVIGPSALIRQLREISG
jgi:8-oxo-dGTP pyrophosphatase MutT (NUDIX family)